MPASPVQGWSLEGAGHPPALPLSAGDVQPNGTNLPQSWRGMLHGNPFPAVYTLLFVSVSPDLLHILQNKEIFSSTVCWKTNLPDNMVTLTSSHSPALCIKELTRIR